MTDDHSQSRPSAAPWVVAAFLLFPVAYILSIGPAAWLHHRTGRGSSTAQAIETAYAPLRWLHDHNEVCGDALEWYMRLWEQ